MADPSAKLRRGAAVACRKPAFLDAAFCVEKAWNYVMKSTIKNCLCKAELALKIVQPVFSEKENDVTDLKEMFGSLSIQIEKDVLTDSIVADDAGSKEYGDVIVAKNDEFL